MGDCKIYIGRISSRTRERDLEDAFYRYGRILKMDLKNGFAFIEYEDPRDADDAIRDMDGRDFDGSRLLVERARGGRGGFGGGRGGGYGGGGYGGGGRGFGGGGGRITERTDHRLIVQNLSSYTSWQDLKDWARSAGNVLYTDVFMKDGQKQGIVEYSNFEDMKEAIRTLDDTKLDDKYIRLVEENPRGGGGGGGGRSRSRSFSPRRSRSRSLDVRRDNRRSRSRSYSR